MNGEDRNVDHDPFLYEDVIDCDVPVCHAIYSGKEDKRDYLKRANRNHPGINRADKGYNFEN